MSKRNTEYKQWVNTKVAEITFEAKAHAGETFGGPNIGATDIITEKVGFTEDGIGYNVTVVTDDHEMLCHKVFPFVAVWEKEVDGTTFYIRGEMTSTKDHIFDLGITVPTGTVVDPAEVPARLVETFGLEMYQAVENDTGTLQQAWEFANLNGFIELHYSDALSDTEEWMEARLTA